MSRYLPITDFRARRRILVRSDFGIAEKAQPRPADLVDEKVWRSIVTLPDDVAIRTSNHHGKTLAQLNELNSAWILSIRMAPYREKMSPAMLEAYDEMQAAIYNCLTGYYRFSVGGMRNVLELVAIGCWAEVCAVVSPNSRQAALGPIKRGRPDRLRCRRGPTGSTDPSPLR